MGIAGICGFLGDTASQLSGQYRSKWADLERKQMRTVFLILLVKKYSTTNQQRIPDAEP
jgi:hypothetical protein